MTDPGKSWIDEVSSKIRRLEHRLTDKYQTIRKEKSPTIETKLYGTTIVSTADEGSELNCIDHRS